MSMFFGGHICNYCDSNICIHTYSPEELYSCLMELARYEKISTHIYLIKIRNNILLEKKLNKERNKEIKREKVYPILQEKDASKFRRKLIRVSKRLIKEKLKYIQR